ncbi:MAG: helix-turn-helix transcriptional regulator [Bacteroidota bacterium]
MSAELVLLQLCENIQRIEGPVNKEPSWVGTMRQILNEQPEYLTLTALSKKLGVHPVHISRAFPKYFASTLGDYLRQQKIKRALGYLLNNKLSLTEIAYQCGFSDQSHFTRTFKAYLHTTPSAFRKQVI